MHTYSFTKIKITAGILIFFLSINFFYNFPLWNQIFHDDSKTISYHGELLLLHLSGETVYQNILKGVNPFTLNAQLMYPFGADYAVNDLAPINGYYFLLLRPFFSIHQSILLIAAISILLAHICMYIFLRRLSISRPAALIMATSFGFTPLLAARMGSQVTYDSIFLYPLIGILLQSLITAPKPWQKIGYALGLGFTSFILILSNLNYTIILGIIIALYLACSITMYPKATYQVIKQNILYITLIGVSAAFFLMPWLKQVYTLVTTVGIPQGSSVGTVEFSGHLLGFFIPSQWNHFYQPLMQKLYTISPYMATQSEGFVYPGLVVVGSILIYMVIRRRLPQKFKKTLLPHLLVALVGALLSLGPYLHIGSHYIFSFAGHSFSIHLPFIFLQKIPFLNNFRSPGRLALILVFAGTIFSAYMIDYLLSRIRTKRLSFILVICLLTVVLIDQDFMHVKAAPQTLPRVIYQELASDSDHGTVMEIPFTLRDGLEYMGGVSNIFYQLGYFIYPNQLIGTHTGRINQYVFDYYRNNAFIGYIGQLIDKDPRHAELFDPLGVYKGVPFNVQEAEKAVNFLNIDAVILNTTELKSPQIITILTALGYQSRTKDGDFVLYRRQSQDENNLCLPFGEQAETLSLARGWDNTPDNESKRWIVGKHASFFIKAASNLELNKLEFTAESLVDNKMQVTIKEQTATISLQPGEHTYELPLTMTMQKGLSPVYLTFTKATAPKSIIPGSTDSRGLSARFSKLCFSSI